MMHKTKPVSEQINFRVLDNNFEEQYMSNKCSLFLGVFTVRRHWPIQLIKHQVMCHIHNFPGKIVIRIHIEMPRVSEHLPEKIELISIVSLLFVRWWYLNIYCLFQKLCFQHLASIYYLITCIQLILNRSHRFCISILVRMCYVGIVASLPFYSDIAVLEKGKGRWGKGRAGDS